MYVAPEAPASVVFTMPAGANAVRWRLSVNGAFSPWSTEGMVVSDGNLTVSVPGELNALNEDDALTIAVLDVDVSIDRLSQSYFIISDDPLVLMENSFVDLSEAMSLAYFLPDMDSFKNADFATKVSNLALAFENLCSYRYFIVYDRNDWESLQRAELPFSTSGNCQDIPDIRCLSAAQFQALKQDFITAIKQAQVMAASYMIAQQSGELYVSPADLDKNLVSEKVGDASRTWKQTRSVGSPLGNSAKTRIAKYISATPRLTRV